jgi:hypothetical protein
MTTITELSAQAGRPTITELSADLGFEAPTEREFKALMRIVQAAHAATRKFVEETDEAERQLWLAFAAVGHLWRRREPDTTRYFGSHVDDVNAVLRRRWGITTSVDARAVLAAIIAHNDVPYRLGDNKVGQPLEAGLNAFCGDARCSNAWRDVLAGRPLKAPLPPRFRVDSPMQVYLQDGR